jgi:hypothetical protein
MTITDRQMRTAWAITHIFETGHERGDYSAVAVLPDGAGISYGVSQATDGSGALDEIVLRYVQAGGIHASYFSAHLDELADPSCPLQHDAEFQALLRVVGCEPVMREIQREVFADLYWAPAVAYGQACSLVLPLSYAVIYDIAIQSGIGRVSRLRRRFDEAPPTNGGREDLWVAALNQARYVWLSGYTCSDPKKQALVRRTVYRPSTFADLISGGRWWLSLPLAVRGRVIDVEDLA